MLVKLISFVSDLHNVDDIFILYFYISVIECFTSKYDKVTELTNHQTDEDIFKNNLKFPHHSKMFMPPKMSCLHDTDLYLSKVCHLSGVSTILH